MVRIKTNAFLPDKENTARYREVFDVYLKLYPALKEIFGDLSVIRGQPGLR